MDSAAPGLDFAAIGHQDSWAHITTFVNGIRSGAQAPLPAEKIKDIFAYIPPRDIFRVKVKSATGATINGVYIETFIDPDKLDNTFVRTNIAKVIGAVKCAQKLGAKMVTLGGFTSIVLEGNLDVLPPGASRFTTGNTLTAAFIINGVEKAAQQLHIDIAKSKLLIIGATGDIGSACTHYFKKKVKQLLLCARNAKRLAELAQTLTEEGAVVGASTDLSVLLPQADIVICAASSTGLSLHNCKKRALICDAGYPKNAEIQTEQQDVHLFHGGMGQVSGGFGFQPDYSASIYQYPAPHVIHGCILEAMVLAFEKRFENFSAGKGNITPDHIGEIYQLSQKHGIGIAPFYNAKGLWPQPF